MEDNIYNCNQIKLISKDILFLLDDKLGGTSLAIKSDKNNFNKIDFRFKKLELSGDFFGILLLRLDEKIYSCFINLSNSYDNLCLKKLLRFNYINFIVLGNSNEHKVYKISNSLMNRILFSIPNLVNKNKSKNSIEQFKKIISANSLWNM